MTHSRIPTIRVATQDDAALLAKLTRDCWVGKPEGSSGHKESTEKVLEDLKTGGAIILELKGEPIGSLRYWPLTLPSTDTIKFFAPTVWEIGRIGILPAHRGKGLSTWLLNDVTMRAATAGIQELRLAVRQDEPGLARFYGRMGFRIDNELVYSHANLNSPAPVVMRKNIFEPMPRRDEML